MLKKSSLFLFMASVIMCFFLSGIRISAGETMALSGTVTDMKGNAVENVLVFLKNISTHAEYKTKTDKNGFFKFSNLPEGNYNLEVKISGFKPFEKKNIIIKKGQSVTVNVQLMTSPADEVLEEEKMKVDKEAGVVGGVVRKRIKPAVPLTGYITGGDFNTEEYSRIYENRYLDAVNNPLSTFSIDVDTASYANVRRFLKNSQLPPKDAVRIEEMINYFDYEYPIPQGKHPFSIHTEISSCPWNKSHKLVHIGLQGKELETKNYPPSNLVFLIDVSGSMRSANKLPLLKSAFKLLSKQLGDKDRVSIVVYAGAAGLILPATPGNQNEKISASIDELRAGGSTAGGAGIKLAYKVAAENYIEEGNNRVVLATDGDFNVGVSSTSELVRMIEKKREEGIFLTTLGFGMGNYKDSRMEQLADKGNGNYHYIDSILEAKKVFVHDMRGTLFTIAKDVKIQVEFNPAKVKAYRLVGYENRMLKDEDFSDDTKDAGELGAGHTVTALYEIIPFGSKEEIPGIDELKYQEVTIKPDAFKSKELMTVKLRYKKPDGKKSQLIEKPLIDKSKKIKDASDNFKFSAAVAQFGLILRDSEYKGNSSYENILSLAIKAKGNDLHGYRAEFIELVKLCELMGSNNSEKY
ncbi:MAG: YfbK domain-containing protein [Candidatus Aminicenantaceae bacterium]